MVKYIDDESLDGMLQHGDPYVVRTWLQEGEGARSEPRGANGEPAGGLESAAPDDALAPSRIMGPQPQPRGIEMIRAGVVLNRSPKRRRLRDIFTPDEWRDIIFDVVVITVVIVAAGYLIIMAIANNTGV